MDALLSPLPVRRERAGVRAPPRRRVARARGRTLTPPSTGIPGEGEKLRRWVIIPTSDLRRRSHLQRGGESPQPEHAAGGGAGFDRGFLGGDPRQRRQP